MADTSTLKQDLFDAGVYDAWQFIQNTALTLQTAEFCRESINKIICRMEGEHEQWLSNLWGQLNPGEGVISSVSITSDNLPKHEVVIGDEAVDSSFLLGMLTKDFFQYTRNAFDCMSQAANAACLAFRAKAIERVDFGVMKGVFGQQTYSQAFPIMGAWYSGVDSSDEFQYIDAFCNRTKHICDVYLSVSMAFLGGENKSIINPFFRKEAQHDKHDIRSYLQEVSDFTNKSWKEFIAAIQAEIVKKTFSCNRHHKLKVYQQKLKGDANNSFSLVYIEGNGTIESMPDEIEVLLLVQDRDGDIFGKNCDIDTIFIQKPNAERDYIGKYVAIEPYGDDTLLRYRSYNKEAHDPSTLPLFTQAMMDEKQKARFYHWNRFLDLKTISDDDDFIARVNLPI